MDIDEEILNCFFDENQKITRNYQNSKITNNQIYQNDVLVHDYVPALDLDGEAGLYDKIDRNFLYNSGTGAFVAGPVTDYD